MPKVILWDADGIAIKRQEEYFSQRFAREHGAPLEEVTKFFKEKYRRCQVGELDLKEELTPLLSQWGWPEDIDNFLEYWFKNDQPDEAVIAKIKESKVLGIKNYLTTDQEKYRKEYLIRLFGGVFDGYWFSCDLGLSKGQPEFFKEILRRWDMHYKPHEIKYWDDDMENIEAAKSIGIDARFYNSIEDLKI